MEGKRRYYQEGYAKGNAARKLNYLPDYEGDRIQRPERQIQSRPIRKAQPASLDLFSMLILSIAILATVYVCVTYLQVQHDLTTLSKEITSIERKTIDLKNENDAAYAKINTSIDLSSVYKAATKKLGMVHANKNQVKEYTSTKSDFVRQYDEIPSGNKESLMKKIIK